MNIQSKAGILGTGKCFPEKILTNFDLGKMVDTTHEWIVTRSGISERKVLDDDVPTYQLGVCAARKAVENAGISVKDLDMIIVTTETPDYLAPSMACIIQNELKATNACAFDLNAACSGFIYGLTIANQFIQTGSAQYILVIACEGLSKVTDWEDRATCVLMGDGSGAAVLGRVDEQYGIISSYLGADGSIGRAITIPCCHMTSEDLSLRPYKNKRVIRMAGREVFKFAVRIMEHATLKALEKAGIGLNDIKLVIPHQANLRIIESAIKKLDLPTDRVFINIHKYGNISSASIAVALNEAVESGLISDGDYILLVGFGAGLTWGSIVIRWSSKNQVK